MAKGPFYPQKSERVLNGCSERLTARGHQTYCKVYDRHQVDIGRASSSNCSSFRYVRSVRGGRWFSLSGIPRFFFMPEGVLNPVSRQSLWTVHRGNMTCLTWTTWEVAWYQGMDIRGDSHSACAQHEKTGYGGQ